MSSLESYKADEIPNLTRRELQALCKSHGIKANSKSKILIKHLQNKWKDIHSNDNTPNKENQAEAANDNQQNESVPEIHQQPIIHSTTEQNEEAPFDEELIKAKSKEENAATVYDDSNYNANPNGNNGSFVDIDNEALTSSAIELDKEFEELRQNVTNNQETYTTHNNMNNGSMINNDIKSPIIVQNNVDDINMLNSSLSLTPKLAKSTEEFIRRSLSGEAVDDKAEIEDEDDVEMEITPYPTQQRIISLDQEITDTPLLGMSASRITVDNEEEEESSSNRSPSWKSTPLKALQILDSIRSEISMEPSSKSEDTMNNKEEESVDDIRLEISFDSSPQSLDKSMEIDEEESTERIQNEIVFEDKSLSANTDDKPPQNASKSETEIPFQVAANTEDKSSENASFEEDKLPEEATPPDPVHIVEPKSEVLQDKNVRKISMTFGDGQVIAFKSVYSPSRSSVRNGTKRRKSMSMIGHGRSQSPEVLCEKTMAIRKMMKEEEVKNGINPMKRKRSTAPDWNAIHNKQIFSRQPDLTEWNKERAARSEKLFGLSANKMSTPSFRSRSKSMIGKRIKTGHSEKKANKKRAMMVPSSNDHLFNHNMDSRLNKKVARNPTPFKKNAFDPELRNKKASKKPRFSVTGFDESISEEKAIVVPKNKLAFDPDKVKSRLFESTSSSKKKITHSSKRSLTPQIKSNPKNIMIANKMKNWSEVKSKIDTNNVQYVSGVKRKLSWSINKNKKDVCEPQQKKRRITISSTINETKEKKWKSFK